MPRSRLALLVHRGDRVRDLLALFLLLLSLLATAHFCRLYLERRLLLGLFCAAALLVLLLAGAASFLRARLQLARELLAFSAESPPPGTLLFQRRQILAAVREQGGRPDLHALSRRAQAELAGQAYLGRYFVAVAVLVGLLGTFAGLMETLSGVSGLLSDESSVRSVLALLSTPLSGLHVTFGASMAGILVTVTLALLQGDLALMDDELHAALEEHTAHRLVPELFPPAEEPAARLLHAVQELRQEARGAADHLAGQLAAFTHEAQQRLAALSAQAAAELLAHAERTGAQLRQHGSGLLEQVDARLRHEGETLSAYARRLTATVEAQLARLAEGEAARQRHLSAAGDELLGGLREAIGRFDAGAQAVQGTGAGLAESAAALCAAAAEFGRGAAAITGPLAALSPELQALSAEVALLLARDSDGAGELTRLLPVLCRLADRLELLGDQLHAALARSAAPPESVEAEVTHQGPP
jgi:hypothetical protein